MITPINGLGTAPVAPAPIASPEAAGADSPVEGFGSIIKKMVEDASQAQVNADTKVRQAFTGEANPHEVILAMEHARLSMMMIVEMRNKAVEAYQELSRMTV